MTTVLYTLWRGGNPAPNQSILVNLWQSSLTFWVIHYECNLFHGFGPISLGLECNHVLLNITFQLGFETMFMSQIVCSGFVAKLPTFLFLCDKLCSSGRKWHCMLWVFMKINMENYNSVPYVLNILFWNPSCVSFSFQINCIQLVVWAMAVPMLSFSVLASWHLHLGEQRFLLIGAPGYHFFLFLVSQSFLQGFGRPIYLNII